MSSVSQHEPPSPYGPGGPRPYASYRYSGPAQQAPEGEKNYVLTVVLSFILGMFGGDRFYLGKTSTAVVKLVTIGGCGLWWLADLLITLFGGQRDVLGYRLAGYARNHKTVWRVFGISLAVCAALWLIMLVVGATVYTAQWELGRWILAGAVVLAAVTGAGAWACRWRRRRAAARAADPVPSGIRTKLTALETLRERYLQRGAHGDDAAGAIAGQLHVLVSDAAELFRRLRTRADKQQRASAQSEYEDRLGMLAEALGEDFLLDVLTHPRLWEKPDERIRDAQEALDALDAQLLENIRQVNARRSLRFRVRLDNLLAPGRAIERDWQRSFDEASDL